MKLVCECLARDLAWVDELARESVKSRRLVQRFLEVGSGVGGRVAVVDKGGAQGPWDVSMLPLGPRAHEQFDVVEGP